MPKFQINGMNSSDLLVGVTRLSSIQFPVWNDFQYMKISNRQTKCQNFKNPNIIISYKSFKLKLY